MQSSKRIEVSLQDQFMQEPKQFLVVQPAHLCNPVDKQGEGIETEDAAIWSVTGWAV